MKNITFSIIMTIATIVIAPISYASTSPWLLNNVANKASHTPLISLTLDQQALTAILQYTPMEGSTSAGYDITIPLPTGELLELSLFEYSMMEPELAARFPDFKTFKAVGKTNSLVSGRFDYTSHGFRGIIRTVDETYYFDPIDTNNSASSYQAYSKSKYQEVRPEAQPFVCRTAPDTPTANKLSIPHFEAASISGSQSHVYRLAVAATGEYTEFHGGSVSDGQAAIVTAINRINEIFDHEIALQFTLIGNNNLLVYTNGNTDPYSNNDGEAMLRENQSNIDSVIGNANYDLGHVFSTGGGGIAQLQAPCSSDKAEGVTGSSSPTADAFWVDYVAHEIGHQLGANHTFNSSNGSCGGNRASSAAYEPGSGTTIMSYAGICGIDNIDENSHDNFHAKSLEEIANFVGSFGSSCGTHTNSNNQLPTANAGNGYTIPQQTPFELTASGADDDGDTLTYNWEQYDLGDSITLGTDNGSSPIFRAYSPSTNPTRTFPSLSSLIANESVPKGETLPSTDRTLTFRLTVRDDNGGVTSADTELNVTTNSGPFAITSQISNSNWNGNDTDTVTWNVADTTISPVSCANVDILLSSDNGNSFGITILTATPNDGSESITFPNTTINTGRIKIKCSDNIFFSINEGAISITETTAPTVEDFSFLITSGASATGTFSSSDVNGDELSFIVVTSPSLGALSLDGENYTYTADNNETGVDSFIIKANDGEFDSNNATASITIVAPSTVNITGPNEANIYSATVTSNSTTPINWESNNEFTSTETASNGLTTYSVSTDDVSLTFYDDSIFNLALLESEGSTSCIDITINDLPFDIDSLNAADEIRTDIISDTRIQLERTNGCDLQANITDASNVAKEINQLPLLSGFTDNKLDVTITETTGVFTVVIEGLIPASGIAF
ncbi:hypothetical protein A9Q99_02935 [Gammaproteobacteria bacterium 45_16_T64]|nr:hypothetical protein A9Q99_02935 [Gammaproteobacteria bacterium 45_16_T64]